MVVDPSPARDLDFKNLGLLIDEEQRFGVVQRKSSSNQAPRSTC